MFQVPQGRQTRCRKCQKSVLDGGDLCLYDRGELDALLERGAERKGSNKQLSPKQERRLIEAFLDENPREVEKALGSIRPRPRVGRSKKRRGRRGRYRDRRVLQLAN